MTRPSARTTPGSAPATIAAETALPPALLVPQTMPYAVREYSGGRHVRCILDERTR
ncbi:hypothetical protein [Streptomyces nitrosporeus]|uniref:hypothetical protein n=1 Tax=Streptomyces nitrosporeus TaxID=28894 RepID=UPI0039A12D44